MVSHFDKDRYTRMIGVISRLYLDPISQTCLLCYCVDTVYLLTVNILRLTLIYFNIQIFEHQVGLSFPLGYF